MKKIKLLYKKYKEIINYIIVGGMTTVVGLGIYYILVISVLDPLKPVELQIANICSWMLILQTENLYLRVKIRIK